MSEQKHAGGCLCGAVRYEATGPLREVTVCHCGQCRKWHGHACAYTAVDNAKFKLLKDADLKWFASSDRAKRGFCAKCGSSLFYRGNTASYTAIAAGTVDGKTGVKAVRHIYVADKGDYYDIKDGLPQLAQH